MKSGISGNFKFQKVYLDCIDDAGNCFIIYWAKLHYCFIRVIYSGLIFSDFKGLTVEKSSLRKTPDIIVKDPLCFNNHLLQIRGSWKRSAEPVSSVLYTSAREQELFWNCHHPGAKTEIVYGDKTYKGFGYAETLTLTIKPWNLPLEELRWGRFLSGKYNVTWIHWKGDFPVNKIFCNGTEYNDAIFEPDRIVFGNGAFNLIFQEISIIRKGKLSKKISKMAWLKVILNSRILNTFEIKYKAKSTLNQNSEISVTGWSLFEIVTWKR